jgi:hypothetical protein
MIMMIENLSLISTSFALLVVLTNIIVQVVKDITEEKIPTRVLAVVISSGLSVLGSVIITASENVTMNFSIAVGSVVTGFVAAYCAMYGYDNLYKELVEVLKKL